MAEKIEGLEEAARTNGPWLVAQLYATVQDIDCALDRIRAAQDGGAGVSQWLQERLLSLIEVQKDIREAAEAMAPVAASKRFPDE